MEQREPVVVDHVTTPTPTGVLSPVATVTVMESVAGSEAKPCGAVTVTVRVFSETVMEAEVPEARL